MLLLSGDSCTVGYQGERSGRVPIGGSCEPRPFLKWAGGKRRLIDQYTPFLPKEYYRYFEPFLGGGALFFHLRPQQAVLGDLNGELINCYRIVKESPEELIRYLRKHRASERHYYRVREIDPAELLPAARAARFIYLNKTCFNGLYRVNKQGKFNVPYGRYKRPVFCDVDAIRAASSALQSAQLKVSSFEKTVKEARAQDFVYFDPPYVPLSPTASFTSYTSADFSERDQKRLAKLARELSNRGCLVMISNSDTELVRDIYADFSINEVRCPRSINSNAFARGSITELVITNY